MTEKLLPCPFTGDIPSIKTSLSSSKFVDGKYLEVHQCVFMLPEYEIMTSIQTDGEESVEDRAIRFWNSRVYLEDVQAAIERCKPKKPDLKTENKMSFYVCESCGNKVFKGMNVCEDCGQRLDWGE